MLKKSSNRSEKPCNDLKTPDHKANSFTTTPRRFLLEKTSMDESLDWTEISVPSAIRSLITISEYV